MHQLLTVAFMVAALTAQAGQALKPWSTNKNPTDQPKNHVEEISSAQQQYSVVQGGTMDGQNCRSPLSCGMAGEGAVEQTWESNRAVRMENVGQTDITNPWLSNGRNNFRNLGEIVTAAITPDMSDKEKALALWFQEIQYRYHMDGNNTELGDPIKVFNVYGHNTCGNDSICLAGLLHKAGLKKVAPLRTMGHCVSQFYFDGRWNELDGDQHCFYLLRDNETIASELDVVRDHDLIKRSHTQGILCDDDRGRDEWEASAYVCDNEINGDRNCRGDTTMKMTLRPGEAIVWRWGHLDPVKCFGAPKVRYPDAMCNGLWEYHPDLSGETWRAGAETVEDVKSGPNGLVAEEGKTGTIVWAIGSPYVILGGHLETEGTGAKFAASLDGKTWKEIGGNFDKIFPTDGIACYRYKIRCELPAGASLKRLVIANDLQMSPLALPGMAIGKNTFTYTDQSDGPRKVRITHEWVERSASRPPEAPSAAVYPLDGGRSDGTDVKFQWKAPSDPDGNKMADYHFELSNRSDMRWPLSTNFYRLISRTVDKGKAQFTLPSPGLLTPGKSYYWHVRAKNDKGVWGPWSKTWSFTADGPAYPVEVAVNYDAARGVGTLQWKPGASGRQSVKYRIYGSDEKGFTVSDAAYKVNVGNCKELRSPFPANFIAETSATELPVIGNHDLADATKTYYRVVAIDQQGKRSGPSDYAAAPRPIIYSKPATQAKVGAEYRYQAQSNRSLGDLRVNGKGAPDFWDIEKPKFTLTSGPKWLKLDPATGVLSGVPDSAGKAEVVLTAAIDRQVRKLDESALKWGQEKIASTTTEKVGSATQSFVIDVAK